MNNTNNYLLDNSFKYINIYITLCPKKNCLKCSSFIDKIKIVLYQNIKLLKLNKKQHHEYNIQIIRHDELPDYIMKKNNNIYPYVYTSFQEQFIYYGDFNNMYTILVHSEIVVAHLKLKMLLN